MNLANANGGVTLKDSDVVDPKKIAKAFRDAGFSVRYVQLVLASPQKYPVTDSSLNLGGLRLRMMNATPETSDKPLMLTLRGVPYEPKPGFNIASSANCGSTSIPAFSHEE